jgi:hypothetical protein
MSINRCLATNETHVPASTTALDTTPANFTNLAEFAIPVELIEPINKPSPSATQEQDIFVSLLTNLTDDSSVEINEPFLSSSPLNQDFTMTFKIAYTGIVIVFLILALPCIILLNAFTLLLLDSLACCFKNQNPSLAIYQKLTLKTKWAFFAKRKGEDKKSHGKFNSPTELKHFKYIYDGDLNDFLGDKNVSEEPNWEATTFLAREGPPAKSRRARAPSSCSPYAMITVDPAQELDRIEKHLSKSICELDEMHRNLSVSGQNDTVNEIDMREADSLINDLIDELNLERDLDSRMQCLKIVEPFAMTTSTFSSAQPSAPTASELVNKNAEGDSKVEIQPDSSAKDQ